MDHQRGRGGLFRPGGSLTRDSAIEAAAVAASLGVDPMLILKASNEDLPVVSALLTKVAELAQQRDEALAIRIANAVGELFAGK